MIITISPTKLQDFVSPAKTSLFSEPMFQNQANELNEILTQYKPEELTKLMSVNPKIALDTYQFIHSFRLDQALSKQAIYAYDGMAFTGLHSIEFNNSDLEFAQQHLTIFSGLYGVVRPLDMIKQYRLEMQTKLRNPKGETLYDYWNETINSYLSEQLSANDQVWINLTSNEYSKIISPKLQSKELLKITPNFKEEQLDGSFKQIIVHTKKARGMMANYIIKNRLTDPEDLKGFDYEGYMFNPQLSNKKEWVFTR